MERWLLSVSSEGALCSTEAAVNPTVRSISASNCPSVRFARERALTLLSSCSQTHPVNFVGVSIWPVRALVANVHTDAHSGAFWVFCRHKCSFENETTLHKCKSWNINYAARWRRRQTITALPQLTSPVMCPCFACVLICQCTHSSKLSVESLTVGNRSLKVQKRSGLNSQSEHYTL